MKKKLAVLTGAGISAESGLKTFRDGDGLWENHSVYDVATPEAWKRDPELVLKFYQARWEQVKNAKPNPAHQKLAELEHDYDVQIITQNIDDLHERGGSSNILHLHGEINLVCTEHRPDIPVTLPNPHEYIKLGDKKDDSQLRPFVVWFGEPVPAMEKAVMHVLDADALVIIGTSLQVYPAAGLVNYLSPEKDIFLLDPSTENTLMVQNKVHHIKSTAVGGINSLIEKIKTCL